MLVGLPLGGYLFALAGLRAWGMGWRAAAIGAATVWGLVVVLLSELLSLPWGLTRLNLAMAWLALDITAPMVIWHVILRNRGRDHPRGWRGIFFQRAAGLPTIGLVWLGGTSLLMLFVALVALVSPPNTWDAMTYHLPRLVHWLQQRSVSPYPTFDIRQLHMPPWAEYAMLQLHALWGGDRLDNLVQWASLLGSTVGVTLVAQQLGAGVPGQVLAAVISATIPQGLLEASGASNDYVVAFWLVALAYYLFALWREPTWPHVAGSGATLGLAWLTKGTAYLFSAALLLMWGLAALRRRRPAVLKGLLVAIILATGLNAVHFARNYRLLGSPFGPEHYGDATLKLTNDALTPGILVSNVLRNLALHLGTPVPGVNRRVEGWIQAVIHAVGEAPNNPQTTWDATTFRVPEPSRHEVLAGNPLHLGLISLALVLLLRWRHTPMASRLALYTTALVVAFLLFCAVVRWQPWHTRLHLPLFVLWSAAVGTLLAHAWPRAGTYGLGLVLLLLAVPVGLQNQLRPLWGRGDATLFTHAREALFFMERRESPEAYRAATAFVNAQGCNDVGLDLTVDVLEYPLLWMLGAGQGGRLVRHVAVLSPSARYGRNDAARPPCAVICPKCATASAKWELYLTSIGPATVFHDIVVFSMADGPRPRHPLAPAAAACTWRFGAGWYGLERSGRDWWRWSDGGRALQVTVLQEATMVLRGEIMSAQPPNRADLLVNDERVMTVAIPEAGMTAFQTSPFRLRPGENTLVLASHAPAIPSPTDGRAVALAARNLLLARADGAVVCALQP